MGGWVYRRVTLLIMVAVSVTLSMATVASTAPPEMRTVCQDGVTKEVPIHAKAKGATEGPCPVEGPDLVAACAALEGDERATSEMITDTRCAVTYEDWP